MKKNILYGITHWTLLTLLTIIVYYPLSFFFMPASMIVSIVISMVYARKINELKINNFSNNLSQIIIGCFIGSSFNFSQIFSAGIPFYFLATISLLLIFLSLAIGLIATKSKFLPGTTGIWGMLPGAAPVMIILSKNQNAEPGLVSFIQYTRVVLVSFLAAIIIIINNHEEMHPILYENDSLNIKVILYFSGAFLINILALKLYKKKSFIFIISIMYSIIISSLGISIVIPNIILSIGFIILGWSIGLNFSSEIIYAAKKSFFRVITLIAILILLSYFLSFLLIYFFHIDPLTAYLATSPGGIDSIAILASGTSAVLPIVISFQIVRFLILLFFGEKMVKTTYSLYSKSIKLTR